MSSVIPFCTIMYKFDKTQKVEIFANKLVEMKQQKDFEKQRQKLKNEEELLRQKLEQKRNQERMKAQQEEQRQKQLEKEKQKYLERERLRSIEKQKQKQKEQQARRQMLEKQKQRKEFERKQSILEEQRRKEEQQRKIQRQYEENCKMAKQIQRRLKQDDERENRARKQQYEMMNQYGDKQEELKKAQKMRKLQDKEQEEERKKKQLQEFARKQFFENQEIMRRARERAQQEESSYNNYDPPHQEEQAPHFGNKNTADNFHYQKRNSVPESPSKAQTKPEFNRDQGKNSQIKNYQSNQEAESKYSSMREQMKKDRENFIKNKNPQQSEPQIVVPEEPRKQEVKTIRAAKWQRPKSRSGQGSKEETQVETQPTSEDVSESKEPNDRTYQFMDPKISPKDEENFNQYLFELENIMQNLNQNLEGIEKNQKKTPSNIKLEPEVKGKDSTKQIKNGSQYLSQMPEEDEVIYRDDDQDTFELSLTANFQGEINKKAEMFPQIEASTDLELFSNFSKLQTLRMNLEDKFGTDNFVQLYRYLENEMSENGIEAFSNQETIVNEASRKFKIGKDLLMESFTLLLTLIHMEQKMMGNH